MDNARPMPSDETRLKQCPCCGRWITLGDFLTNSEVEPIGMSIDPEDATLNYYYFNHECAGCGTTFLVDVMAFRTCIEEPIPQNILTGTVDCAGHCTHIEDLAVCRNECRYAPFRRFLLRMREKRGNRRTHGAARR